MLTFEPHIPLALWAPLALAAAALLATYAVRSRRWAPRGRRGQIIALMALVLAAPLVVLLNPLWVEPVPPPPGKRLLTVLVDRTASMATPDAPSGRTRFQAAEGFVQELKKSLGSEYELRVRTFDETSTAKSAKAIKNDSPDGAVTNLAAALDDALGEDRPQGQAIVLLSDGIDTSGAPASRLWQTAAKGKALSTPIYTHAIGSQQGVADLDVSLNLSQELAFIGQKIPVVARLKHSGPLPKSTKLSLLLDGKEIESHDVALPAGGTAEQVLWVSQNESGLYRYQVRAAALEEEVTDLNNAATLLLRVVDEPVSVLLLEGKPYWDTKFLIRTLSADPSIELTSIVQMAPGRFLQRGAEREEVEAAPAVAAVVSRAETAAETDTGLSVTTAEVVQTSAGTGANRWKIHHDAKAILGDKEFLKSFQIIVLGRNTEVFLNDDAVVALRNWVQSGDGSLVCFRGSPASQMTQRLGALMPLKWSPGREARYRVELTDSGQSMQWLPSSASRLANLPSLASTAQPQQPKPLATVLAASSGEASGNVPLITYQPEGSGRVVVVEGAGMWRWAFLSPEHQQHDETYGTLWRSLVRWLVSNVGLLPSQQAALVPSAVTFRSTQPATATLLLRETGEQLPTVELAGDKLAAPQSFNPVAQAEATGMYRVNFGELPEGRYTATVKSPTGEPVVDDVTTEFEVTGNLQERLDIVARPEVLAEVAKRSGGALLSEGNAGDVKTLFDEHLAQSRPQRIIRTSAWDRWWILAGVLCLWACTWAVRRGAGLV